jgi:hypothetical protein
VMWRDIHGDGSRLHCVISICGTMLHLEALQVHVVGDTQQAVNPEDDWDFTYLCLFGSEGRFETTEIDGTSYVLVATPFT